MKSSSKIFTNSLTLDYHIGCILNNKMGGLQQVDYVQDGAQVPSNSPTESEVSIASPFNDEDILEALLSSGFADSHNNNMNETDPANVISNNNGGDQGNNDECCCCNRDASENTLYSQVWLHDRQEPSQQIVQDACSLDSFHFHGVEAESTEKSIKVNAEEGYQLESTAEDPQQEIKDDDVFANPSDSTDNAFFDSDDFKSGDASKHVLHRSMSDSYALRRRHKKPLKRPKSVHFADSRGYELEVHIPISDLDDYHVPPRLLEALEKLRKKVRRRNNFELSSGQAGFNTLLQHYSLVLSFQQPFLKPSFQERVNRQKVCLESISVIPYSLSLTGVIRVVNMEFEKKVFIRYSTDNWSNYLDISANYVSSLLGFQQDQFFFHVVAPGNTTKTGRLELAVSYQLPRRNEEFWDNNYGKNYVISCLEHQANQSDEGMMT